MTRRLGESVQRHAAALPKSLRILVVDDDRDTALTLMVLLRDEGHEVRAVHSGRSVMDMVREFDPDVILLDIQLPGLSGWEVARHIRARYGRDRPLLIGITGEYKQGADKILSQILGIDHYLLKPYDFASIVSLIEPLTQPGPAAA